MKGNLIMLKAALMLSIVGNIINMLYCMYLLAVLGLTSIIYIGFFIGLSIIVLWVFLVSNIQPLICVGIQFLCAGLLLFFSVLLSAFEIDYFLLETAVGIFILISCFLFLFGFYQKRTFNTLFDYKLKFIITRFLAYRLSIKILLICFAITLPTFAFWNASLSTHLEFSPFLRTQRIEIRNQEDGLVNNISSNSKIRFLESFLINNQNNWYRSFFLDDGSPIFGLGQFNFTFFTSDGLYIGYLTLSDKYICTKLSTKTYCKDLNSSEVRDLEKNLL